MLEEARSLECRKNRDSIEITHDILQAAGNGARKTKIMYKASLGYQQLERYLSKLIQAGLLRKDHLAKRYQTTEKGVRYMRAYFTFREITQNSHAQREAVQSILKAE